MDNNWYDDNHSGASYSSSGGYNNKKKKGVTIGQLIACLLVVALVSGGAGVFLAGYINNSKQPPADTSGNSMIVDEPNKVISTPAPAQSAPAQDAGGSAQDKFNVAPAAVGEDDASTNVVQNSMASVVGIYMGAGETEGDDLFAQDTGSGSGVIITEDGYIATNHHVVNGIRNIHVYLQDGSKYAAELIGSDPYADLAIIKIDAEGLPAAMMGNSSGVSVGETVYAIGNPLGVFTSSVSRGIISGLDRTLDIEGVSMTLMQTDAAVNPGNSGGGLFNAKGELIGIVNAKTASVSVEGLGFAIPIDTARPIMADLIDLGYVTGRPYLGISMQDVSLRYGNSYNPYDPFNFYFNNSYVTRVQVMKVEEGGAAHQGGMLVNDIITALDGTEVTGTSKFSSLLYEYNVGDTVTITVLRGNESIDLSITLGQRS